MGKEKTRGVNAWRLVIGDAIGMTGARFQGLVGRIFSPTRVGKFADTEQALTEREVLGGV